MSAINSPFPGMDPFLEHAAEWRGVHTRLIVAISDLIADMLPVQFVVKIEGSVQLIDWDGDVDSRMFPDVFISRKSAIRESQLTTVAIAAPTTIVTAPNYPKVTYRWLEIKDRESREVITTIEILSPFNKTGKGYEEFKAKRKKVIQSQANWLEIDLLRSGKRPFELVGGTSDYYAMMRRANSQEFLIWSMPLRSRLLTIGVPLADGYDDVPLNLQLAVNEVYLRGRFGRDLNYSRPVPPPKLSAENEAWVQARITQWREKHTVSG